MSATYLQETSSSSASRKASSFSAVLEPANFILTRGGTAKSTSKIAVPNFMLLCIRFAVIALLINALANILPLGAFTAIAVTLFMSLSPF